MNDKFRRLMRQIVKAQNRDRMDTLADRWAFAQRVNLCAERGKVAMVSGGMDCDCARWDNVVTILPAIPIVAERAVKAHVEDEWADGPRWARIAQPSSVVNLRRTSRDLAAEAFEDGHPHVVFA